MDCRGMERRRWIVDHYTVVPVAHLRLLNGITKQSDAGRKIKNEYYVFKATPRRGGDFEIIECGMKAARHFLELINHDGLPIFNPLCGEGSSGGGTGEDGRTARRPLHKESQQLYNAIMWVITLINAQPDTPIFKIKDKMDKFGHNKPFDREIKGVNTIIENKIGITLTEKINELRDQNRIRDELCTFNLLEDRMNALGIKSYY